MNRMKTISIIMIIMQLFSILFSLELIVWSDGFGNCQAATNLSADMQVLNACVLEQDQTVDIIRLTLWEENLAVLLLLGIAIFSCMTFKIHSFCSCGESTLVSLSVRMND